MSTNGNIFRYFIKLLLRGFDKSFIYEVGMEEIDRLRNLLADLPQQRVEKRLPNLFMFNTANQLVVGVSPVEIQLAHFLFERSTDRYVDEEAGEMDPERSHVHLYFRGRAEPYKISAAESGDVAVLYFRLEAGAFASREFYSFLDIDGEEVAICLPDVLVAEFRKEILDEGIEKPDAEDDTATLDDF
ncbi:MAG: hypothetical protein ALAOOOJD_04511 [bacterium]|nr:hypothetical protein [bacterium]